MTVNTHPSFDQFEVSVFGPGYGECIVIHAGESNWLIIDSCIDKNSNQPKSISYLTSIGVDVSTQVRFIAATHWHDDHVAGISQALTICSSAVFSCPVSLSNKEFLNLAQLYRTAPIYQRGGTYELLKCIEIAASRTKAKKINMLKYCMADTQLMRIAAIGLTVQALSPSDEMTRRCNEFMLQKYKEACQPNGNLQRVFPVAPNDTAAALKINLNGRFLILGSDLEECGDPSVGWSSVLQSHAQDPFTGAYFKIAHHGSITGHHDGVWNSMLQSNPISMLTPFRRGKHKLPNRDDRERISRFTTRAYISADPNITSKPKSRSNKVEALINSAVTDRRLALDKVGHIRWRGSLSDLNDEGSIELFDGAKDLSVIT